MRMLDKRLRVSYLLNNGQTFADRMLWNIDRFESRSTELISLSLKSYQSPHFVLALGNAVIIHPAGKSPELVPR
jgi:hypothetical protein